MSKDKGLLVLLVSTFLLPCFFAAGLAQAAGQTKETTLDLQPELEKIIREEKEEPLQQVETYLRFLPSSRAKAVSGKIAITESASEYSYALKAFGKLPVKFSLGTAYIGIDDNVEVSLPTSLTSVWFGSEVILPFFKREKTYLRLALYPSLQGQNWSFNTSSFYLPVQTSLIYQPQDRFTGIFGVAVYPGYENEIFPILGCIYKPGPRLILNLVPWNPNITYTLSEKIDIFLEGKVSFKEFKVKKDDFKNTSLAYREKRLGCGLKYKLGKNITCSLSAGSSFNRRFKYRDNLGKVTLKDGSYLDFRVNIFM